MKTLVLSLAAVVLSAPLNAVNAAEQPLDGVAAVINGRIITFAEVRAISADAEAEAARQLSGDELRKEIAKIRLSTIEILARQKH